MAAHSPCGNSNSSKNKPVRNFKKMETPGRSAFACDINTGVVHKARAGGEVGESSSTCFDHANGSFRIKLLAVVLPINGCIGGRAVPNTNGVRAKGKSSLFSTPRNNFAAWSQRRKSRDNVIAIIISWQLEEINLYIGRNNT